ncbi:MAG TPA: type II toxin-antitoxin system PemK/MazF family toxin [Steroidobacteraceae bacterium]|jgi:mRNA interferase MazF|nr:type II toxin-antitoxin system PemK/MazF family toxin [Steroidobacteraceae bacterium]
MNRGDICWYTFKAPDKKRPVLVLTRESAIAVLNSVTIAPITSTVRSIPTELLLTKQDGVPHTCAANFDNLQTVSKSNIGERITRLTSRRMKEAAAAVSFALGFDDE